MSDEQQMDARLEVVARYRDLGTGVRFMLWLSYPGLRDSFEALDRATGRRGTDSLGPDSTEAQKTGRARSWPCRTGACWRKDRRDSSPGAAAVGCGRGR